MTTFFHWRAAGLLLGLLLSAGSALAQAIPAAEPVLAQATEPAAATVTQRAQHLSAYLADALRLNARQATKLRAAVEKRLESADMLGHLLFASSQAAFAAYENLDYNYYATIGKLLTPSQFHLLMQLDEPVTPADMPVLVQRH
jgi:hypothetical protein